MGDNKREIFLSSLQGEIYQRSAVACVNQTSTYNQMKVLGASWPDTHSNPCLMAQLAEGAHSVLGLDAVRIPFCQTIEEEALGCTITPGDSENLPSIKTHPYNLKEHQSMEMPKDFLSRGRVPALIQAAKKLKDEVGNEAAVIGGIIGPFTVVAELVGITDCLKYASKKPDALKPFLEVVTKCSIQLAEALVDAGVDAICIEDMMASIDMISPKIYRQLAVPSETAVIDKIKVPTILHICGKVDYIVNDMISTGAAALSFEPKTNMEVVLDAVKKANRKVGLIGGVDTMDHLFYGDQYSVQEAVYQAIKAGYSVVAPGCAIPPGTEENNVTAMVEAVRTY